VQAGIHGDEVAGVHAVQELLEERFRPERGRVIFVPVMNPAAYRARTRGAPGGLDLNRCFPGDADAPEVERRLAARFMALVRDEAPAVVATLHESRTRYSPDVTPSFGQTLVYGVTPCPTPLQRVVERLNAEQDDASERWSTLYYPVATSSTEVIVDAFGPSFGTVGTCVETWMGFPERQRVNLHKRVVRHLLAEFGLC
jgi:hypothetical protein